MTVSEAELRNRLEESENLPYGDGRTAVVEEILAQAEAIGGGPSKLAFDVRMELISCYENGAQPDRAFVPFAWCLAAFDRGELEFTDWDAELLRWYYKWMIGAMRRFPTIGLNQVNAALDDMERRYRAGGHSMHAVHMLRCLIHSHLGDRDAAEEEFAKWIASPRDENSDCAGCEPTKQLSHHVWMGRDEEGLALAEPVVAGQLGCREQPQSMLAEMMLPLVRVGRLDEAREAHLKAYRRHRGNRDAMADIADHIEFCALTGNEARGLDILTRHLDWVDRPREPYSDMAFAASGALLLRRLEEIGHGDLTVSWRSADVPVRQLRTELTERVRTIAAKFDARNGNTYQSERFEGIMAAQPLVDELPLGGSSRPAGRTVRAVVTPPAELPGELTPEEIADLAEKGDRTSDSAWSRLEKLAEAGELPESVLPRWHEEQADRAIRTREPEKAAELARRAIDEYVAIGDVARAARAKSVLAMAVEADEGLALLAEARKVESPYAVEVALRQVQALARAERYHEAMAAAMDAVELAGDNPLAAAAAYRMQARLHGRAGRLTAAAEAAEKARTLARQNDDPIAAAGCAVLLAQILYDDDRAQEAFDATAEVLAVESWPAAELPTLGRAYELRWVILRDAGQAGEQAAVDAALGGLDIWHEVGDRQRAAFSGMNLGFSYYLRGQWLDAAELLEQALHELAEGSDDALAARSLLGTCQARLGEHVDAAENLARSAAGFLEVGEFRRAGNDLIESGTALTLAERTDDALDRFSSAAELMAQADWPYGVVVALQHQARVLMNSEEVEEAYEIAVEAYERARALPESDAYDAGWVRADAADDVARILQELDRFDEAFGPAREAAAGYRAAGDEASAAATHLLIAMLRIGTEDAAGAEADARRILLECQETATPDVLYRARAVLATALHKQGRDAESEAIWAELTPD
ncbi:hypothetical protein [Fodinicola acaciae]|uniref:hypothetical protein n=1 Tax=Fodinicola acaciae TaxID=2681555 RepID=UPI0013D105B5|nr:hypothetical protein [Fodinicola acaciae]